MRPGSSRVGGAGVFEGGGEYKKGKEDNATDVATDDATPGARDRRRETQSSGPGPAVAPVVPLSSPSSPPTTASSGGDDGENGEDDEALANENDKDNDDSGKWRGGRIEL